MYLSSKVQPNYSTQRPKWRPKRPNKTNWAGRANISLLLYNFLLHIVTEKR